MPKLFLLMIVVLIGFSSCGPNELIVKTKSGQSMVIKDYDNIYVKGDSVMISRNSARGWSMDQSDITAIDTTIVYKGHPVVFKRAIVKQVLD